MKAALYDSHGPAAEVLRVEEVDLPETECADLGLAQTGRIGTGWSCGGGKLNP